MNKKELIKQIIKLSRKIILLIILISDFLYKYRLELYLMRFTKN